MNDFMMKSLVSMLKGLGFQPEQVLQMIAGVAQSASNMEKALAELNARSLQHEMLLHQILTQGSGDEKPAAPFDPVRVELSKDRLQPMHHEKEVTQ